MHGQRYLGVLRQVLQEVGNEAARRARAVEEDDSRISDDQPNLIGSTESLARFIALVRRRHLPHFAFVALLVTTGARISTAIALQRDDFDPERGIVIARRRRSGKEVVEGSGCEAEDRCGLARRSAAQTS